MKLKIPHLMVAALAAVILFSATFAPDVLAATALLQAPAQDPGVLFSLATAPTILSRSIGQAYERKGEGDGSDDDNGPAIVEVKRVLDKLGRAWEEYKTTNDALVKAKADGKVLADLEAKLDKISADLDKMGDVKSEFDALLARLQRPGAKGDDGAGDLAKECKAFHQALLADAQTKGRAAPAEVTVDQYAEYKSGFLALARHGNVEQLTPEQRKAMSVGSDPDGGFMMPPSTIGRVVTRMFEQSVMRQIATVQPLGSDALEGIVEFDDMDAGWVSEIGTRNDTNNPKLKKYRIEAHELYAQPKVTQKLIDDASQDIEAWLANKTADKFGRVEGLAFWRGTADGQPRGLAAYSTAATGDDTRDWGVIEHVVTGANGDFHTTKMDPLQDIQGTLKDQYLQNAQWCMRREVRTKLRKLKESTSDRYLWEPSLQVGQPERLNGYAVRVDQYMPALATGSLSLAFGDFREAYTIVDRMGIRTLRDPFTAKPYVRFYSTKRVGGGCVNFEAVKFLKFST